MTTTQQLERSTFGIFVVGGALSGGYLLGLGQATGWWLIAAVLAIGAMRLVSSLGRRPKEASPAASSDPALQEVFDQLEARGRAVFGLLESCQRGDEGAAIPLEPIQSTVRRTLAEARDAIGRWESAAAEAGPRREALEARRRACERLSQLAGDESSRAELALTVEHQERTLELIEAAERARWSFWLGLERLLSTLESIDLALRMALTRDRATVDPTDLEALVEAMAEAAGTLRLTADELGG